MATCERQTSCCESGSSSSSPVNRQPQGDIKETSRDIKETARDMEEEYIIKAPEGHKGVLRIGVQLNHSDLGYTSKAETCVRKMVNYEGDLRIYILASTDPDKICTDYKHAAHYRSRIYTHTSAALTHTHMCLHYIHTHIRLHYIHTHMRLHYIHTRVHYTHTYVLFADTYTHASVHTYLNTLCRHDSALRGCLYV